MANVAVVNSIDAPCFSLLVVKAEDYRAIASCPLLSE
jgi:hypothetical protein